MRKSIFNTFTICFLLFFFTAKLTAADFTIVSGKDRATICIDPNETSVVRKAAGMFQNDVSEIAGVKPLLQKEIPSSGNVIIAGTFGKSKLLQSAIKKYHLSTDSVAGKWEAFYIQIIERKQGKLLVVMGSDRRGTAYGILELSRLIGISPWVWWADVKPKHKSELSISIVKSITDKPAVKYRGIFLNDEDWGLKPWASKTFEPEVGEIGPKTYGKIFELLLRLRANTIWPAMHECTTPFYFVKGNAAMADSFGIIVSTSHCEPLMRSNPLEWDHKTRGDYNFFTNKKGVIDYWSERLTEASNYENVYTVGMRGIHDGAMEGAKTVQQQVEGQTDVFKEQRSLLQKFLKKNPEEIPQIFIPYKEVLDAYNAGLKVPDDVTLVWCDDNYGYLTRLSNAEEQKRKGGAGVYYHISYWGRPHDYLWLATTQPALIWQEMQRAWAYNARKMWIFNVGDIKPGEYLTEFCLDLAWNPKSVKRDNISGHLQQWMGKTFGAENATPLKNIMDEYYRLAFIRRPEFMGWSQTEPNTKVKPSDLNFTEFGDEIATRLKQYDQLEQQVNELESKISPSLRSAFYELVKYPVTGASLINKKWLNWQYANLFAVNNLSATQLVSQRSLNAYEKIQQMTAYYNDSLE
ncbi:MAG: glycosyl hydrolase 115 family protein, partial [Bacteroidota bacterium]|nr:glycosyl hydrolase 115 family protein [Bacteroidota bacterium]